MGYTRVRHPSILILDSLSYRPTRTIDFSTSSRFLQRRDRATWAAGSSLARNGFSFEIDDDRSDERTIRRFLDHRRKESLSVRSTEKFFVDARRRHDRCRKFRSTCLSSRESRRHSYLPIGRTAESVPRGVHRPNELQQLSPLADSRCSYLNNIPNSLASLTRNSPASHHTDREYRTTFFQGRTSPYSETFERKKCFRENIEARVKRGWERTTSSRRNL